MSFRSTGLLTINTPITHPRSGLIGIGCCVLLTGNAITCPDAVPIYNGPVNTERGASKRHAITWATSPRWNKHLELHATVPPPFLAAFDLAPALVSPALVSRDKVSVFPLSLASYQNHNSQSCYLCLSFMASTLQLSPQYSRDQYSGGGNNRTVINVATTFYPGATFQVLGAHHNPSSDLLIHTSDSIFFYVHKTVILSRSSNDFNGHLAPEFDPIKAQSYGYAFHDSTIATGSPVVGDQSSSSSPTARAESIPPLDMDFLTSNAGGGLGTISNQVACYDSPETFPPLSLDDSGYEIGRFQRPRTSSSTCTAVSSVTPTSTTIVPQLIAIPEPASVLNVVLHVLYNLPCSAYSPTLATLSQIFPFMSKYGFSHHQLVPHNSEIASLLLSHASEDPLQVYTIAASNKMEHLCVQASQYTLGVPLSLLTDGQALMMGPIYLKRLFFLHMGRAEALKRILLASSSFPPELHAPEPGTCSLEEQKAVVRAWSLAMAYLLTTGGDAGAGLQNTSTGLLASSLGPLANSARCGECREVMLEKMRDIVHEWSLVKMTI